MDYQQKPGSLSVYDYSDKSIQHAWLATGAYAAAKAFGFLVGLLQGTAHGTFVIGTVVIEIMVILFLAFWIYKKSRVAVVLMLVYVIGTQLFVWLVLRSFSGTIVSVIVTGFLLRGATRAFQFHRENESIHSAPPSAAPDG